MILEDSLIVIANGLGVPGADQVLVVYTRVAHVGHQAGQEASHHIEV